MANLMIKEKEMVVPGQVLAEGMDYLPAKGTYREGNEIKALQIGMAHVTGRLIKLILSKGPYIPKVNDTIIGKVTNVGIGGWLLDMGFSNLVGLRVKDATNDYIPKGADLSSYYNFGDYVVAKLIRVTKEKLMDLTTKGRGLRKLDEGIIINVSSVKVPRIIGKGGSMISMIKEKTDCRIMVGQNGIIWISGTDVEKERLAINAIYFIEEKAHLDGLTDMVKDFLEGKKVEKDEKKKR